MKPELWKKLRRILPLSLLCFALVFGSGLSVLAEEAPAPAPALSPISPWSVPTLHEGEKYGIFPLEWYYDGFFQSPISSDKFASLINDTIDKLDAIGLTKKATKLALPAAADKITRDTVAQTLYAILAQYELPEAFGIGSLESIEYLRNKGIIFGTKQGLELDKPATVEQAVVLASRLVQFAYDTADAGAKGLMWKVTHEGNTLYLLGSIHVGIPEMYPMHKDVRDAMQGADALYVEANLQSGDQEAMAYFNQTMVYTEGTTVKDHISKETYERVQKASEKLGLPAQAFDAYKPWVITNNLSLLTLVESPQELGQASALGVDMYYIGRSMFAGMPIEELEGVKFQADLLSGVPLEDQVKELNEVLDAVLANADNSKEAKEFEELQLLWAKGDLEGFSKSFEETGETESESSQRLFGERDKNMAKKLVELLEADGKATYFVVVGAGHLVIEDMVIDQLKDKGYKVEFVK